LFELFGAIHFEHSPLERCIRKSDFFCGVIFGAATGDPNNGDAQRLVAVVKSTGGLSYFGGVLESGYLRGLSSWNRRTARATTSYQGARRFCSGI
jgi:hypothetical protein